MASTDRGIGHGGGRVLRWKSTKRRIEASVSVAHPLRCPGIALLRAQKTRPPRGRSCPYGGGGGNRTRVRRHSIPGTTCLARCSISDDGNTTCEARRHPYPLRFGTCWRVATGTY